MAEPVGGREPAIAGEPANAAERRRDALLTELTDRRADFLAALADVDPDLRTAPGLVGAWSARDLVVHVAFWSDHAADALALAAAGRAADFAFDASQTDAMNDRVFLEGRGLSMDAALAREDATFRRFQAALGGISDAQLEVPLGNGDSVEEVVRYDGPDHFAEHTGQIRAWFSGAEEPDADE
jgi:DinB family protein